MASSLNYHLTNLPLPSDPGGEAVPVHFVTRASQLPPEFLHPSSDKKLVIGFDCEGVDLCRNGTLCIMQLAFPDAIYLVDAIEGGKTLVEACKPALESSYITKVIHDCKRDSEALYFQFNIKLHNVFDTQVLEPHSRRVDEGFSEARVLAEEDFPHNAHHREISISISNFTLKHGDAGLVIVGGRMEMQPHYGLAGDTSRTGGTMGGHDVLDQIREEWAQYVANFIFRS